MQPINTHGIKHYFNPLVLTLLIFALLPTTSKGESSKIDSLYTVLDSTITKIPQLIAQKEARISQLSTELISAPTDARRYELNGQLYDECCKYNYDKAMMFLNNNLQLAEKSKNKRWLTESLLRQAKLLVSTFALKEAGNIIDTIKVETLTPELQRNYYSIRQLYYFYLMEFSDKYFMNKYREQYDANNQQILELAKSSANEHLSDEFRYSYCRAQADNDSKLLAFRELMKHLDQNNPYYGSTSASISDLYRIANDQANYLYFLIEAAISDLKVSTKEYSALQQLALYLSENGDVERAYRYINISMQDAIAFNARHRIMDASQKYILIQSAYKHQEDVKNHTLKLTLIISMVVIVLILLFIIYIKKQSSKLLTAYSHLNELNAKYKKSLILLQELSRSKDKYLVQLLTMTSSFLEKQADFKRLLYKKIVNGKTEDIYKTLKLSIDDNQELDLFYKLFDNAIHDLFPNFVAKVNELLQPDKQFEIKTSKELNAELRIVALIRLGINDNAQISHFLRYSIGTIYTYRSRVRNNALNPATFENLIAAIDLVEPEAE